MDLLTSLPLPAALLMLALLDGLSTGTLLIPTFLLIAPGRARVRRIVLYLATITAFYWAVGIACLLGLVAFIGAIQQFIDSTTGAWLKLCAGVALFAIGLWLWYLDSRNRRRGRPGGGRLLVWRERLLSEQTGRRGDAAVVGVALAAGVAEVATMLPYLIAMTMLADAPLPTSTRVAALAGYCVAMIVPALILLIIRLLAAQLIAAPLARFAAWMQRTGLETSSWLFCIIGVIVVRSASLQLDLRLPLIG